MGGNCGKSYPSPNTTNQCSGATGDRYTIPYFCTLEGPAGDSYRSHYCSALSNAGEWGNPNQVNSSDCSYNDCNNFQQYDFGCCDGCCGIVGSQVSCERLTFTGDPVTCCLANYECSHNPNACFSDPSTQNTCAPDLRNTTSTGCQDVLFQYCTGTLSTDDPNSTSWLDRWTQNNGGTGSCNDIVLKNIYKNNLPCDFPFLIQPEGICNLPPIAKINAEGYFWGQQLISATMKKYTEQGFEIGALPGSPGYNPWQNFIYDRMCCSNPGICQSGLEVACAAKNSQRISFNPEEAKWCGCFLSQGTYEEYSIKYNVPKECSPTCNRSGTIPIVGINGMPTICRQNICIIDDVTVNLVNSQIGGGINFENFCGNCQGTNCSCIISSTQVDITNSTISGNVVPVLNSCGTFSCTQTNPGLTGPNIIATVCGKGPNNPYEQYDANVAKAKEKAHKESWSWTLIIVCISLILIFLIIFFIHPITIRPTPVASQPNTIPKNNEQSSIIPSSKNNIVSTIPVSQSIPKNNIVSTTPVSQPIPKNSIGSTPSTSQPIPKNNMNPQSISKNSINSKSINSSDNNILGNNFQNSGLENNFRSIDSIPNNISQNTFNSLDDVFS